MNIVEYKTFMQLPRNMQLIYIYIFIQICKQNYNPESSYYETLTY